MLRAFSLRFCCRLALGAVWFFSMSGACSLLAAEAAAPRLAPLGISSFFVQPGQPALLRWRTATAPSGGTEPYLILDYQGRELERGQATVADDGTLGLRRVFARGYGEIVFPEAKQSFGVVSLEPCAQPADPFFGMDAGLSWLELDPARRAGLVEILARSGIGIARERLGLGSINPEKGKYDWETRRQFDTVRRLYAEKGVSLLEILDGGGKHLDLARETYFARQLPEWSATVAAAARHWPLWGGAEVANEPDLKALPAEQYVPLVKATSHAFTAAGVKTPVVAGVFATIPPGPYFDACTANGLLEDADVVSFHSYDRAPSVEGMVARYRAWLRQGGREALPLWHTECGWSWPKGPERPPRAPDAESALEIAAKAVESRACGVARYFPFVYVFYEEGPKNFGMMGRDATPLRSMAAYAAAVHALSHSEYLGDLGGLPPAVRLARVFGRPGEGSCVAVLYTGKVDAAARIDCPMPVRRVTGADGRDLAFSAGQVPVPDGLGYLWLDRAALGPALQPATAARVLYTLGRPSLASPRLASPLVLQFMPQPEAARASSRRYLLTQEGAHHFPVTVRVHNLSEAALTFSPHASLPGGPAANAPAVTVPPQAYREVSWTLDVASGGDIAQTRFLTVTGECQPPVRFSPLAIPIILEGTLEQHLARHPRQQALPIADLARWKPNASPGSAQFSHTEDGAWRLEVKYAGASGNWAYPKFRLPAPVDPAVYSGLLIRLRVLHAASGVAVIAGSDGAAPSFWVNDLCPADGSWHTVYIPFAEFKPGPNGAGQQNSRLEPGGWKELSLGMGSRTPENALEVSHLVLVGGGE